MMHYITVDTGTTNTRVKVWRQDAVVARAFAAVGVRDTAITGSRRKLQEGVREALAAACAEAGIAAADAAAVVASGMISSNVGLHEVPHVVAPAGVVELAAGMAAASVPEVCVQPIWFIPGVKNAVSPVDIDNCEQMDIMRGEEAEVFGVVARMEVRGPAVFVLPGSHSKFIALDGVGRITACLTTMAGELLDVITNNTILANALGHSLASRVDGRMVLAGADHARRVGLTRACFTVRILDQFTGCGVEEKASFLLGAVLGTDLTALKNSRALAADPAMPLYIMGKRELRAAFRILLENDPHFRGGLFEVGEDIAEDVAGFGALTVARARGVVV